MMTRLCDRCGQPIPRDQLRYLAKIQVFAASDPLEISQDDLQRNHDRELEAILQQCAGMSEAELMRDVFVEFTFDLCRSCQRSYIAAPLPAVPDRV